MKLLLFILFSFQAFEANHDAMKPVRVAFHEISTERELDQFIQGVEALGYELAQPYLASAIMQKAKYAFLPTSKLKQFKKGKKLLESYIKMYPDDLEARYVRVLVQQNVPKILGYNSQIESDIAFIKLHLEDSKLPLDYKKIIHKILP